MTFTSQQIEAITQDVLRELRSLGVAIAAQGESVRVPPPSEGRARSHRPVTGECRPVETGPTINTKVITEESLAAASAAGRTVSIPAGAVITPSGHDYIRRNQVSITNGSTTNVASESGLVIIVGQCSAATSAAATANWQSIEAGCEYDAAHKARKQLPSPVVCCGGEPSMAACLLNRNNAVRAAVVTPNTDITILGSSMNPQVVCVSSVGWTFAAFLKIFRQLGGIGSAVPSKWRELR